MSNVFFCRKNCGTVVDRMEGICVPCYQEGNVVVVSPQIDEPCVRHQVGCQGRRNTSSPYCGACFDIVGDIYELEWGSSLNLKKLIQEYSGQLEDLLKELKKKH